MEANLSASSQMCRDTNDSPPPISPRREVKQPVPQHRPRTPPPDTQSPHNRQSKHMAPHGCTMYCVTSHCRLQIASGVRQPVSSLLLERLRKALLSMAIGYIVDVATAGAGFQLRLWRPIPMMLCVPSLCHLQELL